MNGWLHSNPSQVGEQNQRVWWRKTLAQSRGTAFGGLPGNSPQKWSLGADHPAAEQFLLPDKQFQYQFCVYTCCLHDLCSWQNNLSKKTDDDSGLHMYIVYPQSK